MQVPDPRRPHEAGGDAGPAPRVPLMAIAVGILVDIGGSVLAGIVIGVIYVVYMLNERMPLEQIEENLNNIAPGSALDIAALALGGMVSIGAGYACARLSLRRAYRCAAVVAAAGFIYSIAAGRGHYGMTENIVLALAGAVLVMAGAWWYVRGKRRYVRGKN